MQACKCARERACALASACKVCRGPCLLTTRSRAQEGEGLLYELVSIRQCNAGTQASRHESRQKVGGTAVQPQGKAHRHALKGSPAICLRSVSRLCKDSCSALFCTVRRVRSSSRRLLPCCRQKVLDCLIVASLQARAVALLQAQSIIDQPTQMQAHV